MAEPTRDLRAQQASEREDQMVDRFGLTPGGEGRPGVDALLPLHDERQIPFEVKSSDTNSVSTARDVGREHIEKWRRRHWLFGFYVRGSRNPPVARSYIYASPRQLEPWIAAQERYVLPDWELVHLLPILAEDDLLIAVAGEKDHYTLDDAQRLLKQQKLEAGEHMTAEMRSLLEEAGLREPRKMSKSVYEALMDQETEFSALALQALMARLAEPPAQEEVLNALGDSDFHPADAVDRLLRGRKLAEGGRLLKQAVWDAADRQEGFSSNRMLALLRERIRYLLDRGATRNNPHISETRLLKLVPDEQVIEAGATRLAQRLEELVERELQEIAAATDAATA